MSNCNECGGFTNSEDVGARYARHHYECTCVRCEMCDTVVGNTIESFDWNEAQIRTHYIASHRPTPKDIAAIHRIVSFVKGENPYARS